MAGTLYKPRAKSFWLLVRRLLCRKKHRPTAAATEEEDGHKSSLLGRRSLEELLGSDGGAAACQCASSQCCAKQHGQHAPLPGLQRPEEGTAASAGGGAPVQYRRFMFVGFRRRLLMRRPWRPMLVAIPE